MLSSLPAISLILTLLLAHTKCVHLPSAQRPRQCGRGASDSCPTPSGAVTLSSVLCLSRTQLHYAAVSTPRPSGERFSLLHAAASRSVQRSRLSRPATE